MHFIYVDHQMDIKINKLSLDMEVDAMTQPSASSNELAPMIKAQQMTFDINSKDIDDRLWND